MLLQDKVLPEGQIAEFEAKCDGIRDGLDKATFEDQRRYFELLNVHGKLVVENEEKVVYVSCRFKQPRLSAVQILPWSSKHNGTEITLTARLVIETAHLV